MWQKLIIKFMWRFTSIDDFPHRHRIAVPHFSFSRCPPSSCHKHTLGTTVETNFTSGNDIILRAQDRACSYGGYVDFTSEFMYHVWTVPINWCPEMDPESTDIVFGSRLRFLGQRQSSTRWDSQSSKFNNGLWMNTSVCVSTMESNL